MHDVLPSFTVNVSLSIVWNNETVVLLLVVSFPVYKVYKGILLVLYGNLGRCIALHILRKRGKSIHPASPTLEFNDKKNTVAHHLR